MKQKNLRSHTKKLLNLHAEIINIEISIKTQEELFSFLFPSKKDVTMGFFIVSLKKKKQDYTQFHISLLLYSLPVK